MTDWKFELAETPRSAPDNSNDDMFDDPVDIEVRESFSGAAAPLNGRTPDWGLGGNWITWANGGGADFATNGVTLLQRSDMTGFDRMAVFGSPNMRHSVLMGDVQISDYGAGATTSAIRMIARRADANNFIMATYKPANGNLYIERVTSFVSGWGISFQSAIFNIGAMQKNVWYHFRFEVDDDDWAYAYVHNSTQYPPYSGYPQYPNASAYIPGAPTTGLVGIGDNYWDGGGGGVPSTRTWEYLIGWEQQMNPENFVRIGELTQASNRNVQLQLNRPGGASFDIPLVDPIAEEIKPQETCILAYRDNQIRWSGPVWGLQEQAAAGRESMTVNAMGWLELAKHRLTDYKTSFSNQSDYAIARSLLMAATRRFPFPFIFEIPLEAGVARTRTAEKYANVGSIIEELSEIENGFDYEVVYDTTRNTIVWKFYRRIGIDKPDIHFAYNWGPDNLTSISRSFDSARLANHVTATGRYAQAFAPPDTANPLNSIHSAAQEQYGLFEEQAALSEVVDTNILLAYAGAEVLYREHPIQTFDFAPKAVSDANDGMIPQLFTDYNLGDTIRLTAKKGRMDFTAQPVRIFGASIGIDNEGNENISQIRTQAS